MHPPNIWNWGHAVFIFAFIATSLFDVFKQYPPNVPFYIRWMIYVNEYATNAKRQNIHQSVYFISYIIRVYNVYVDLFIYFFSFSLLNTVHWWEDHFELPGKNVEIAIFSALLSNLFIQFCVRFALTSFFLLNRFIAIDKFKWKWVVEKDRLFSNEYIYTLLLSSLYDRINTWPNLELVLVRCLAISTGKICEWREKKISAEHYAKLYAYIH